VLVLYFAPLPAIGLLPYLVLRFIQLNAPLLRSAETVLDRARRLLADNASFRNLVISPVMAFVVLAFYGSQVSGSLHGFIWQIQAFTPPSVLLYLAFCILEFGVFAAFVFHQRSEGPMLVMTFLLLAIIPLYLYGPNNDFAMRASIPALVVLFAAGSRNILARLETPGPRTRLFAVLLAIVMLAGSVTPLHEMGRSWSAIAAEGGPAGYRKPEATWGDCTRDPFVCREHVVGIEGDTLFFGVLAR